MKKSTALLFMMLMSSSALAVDILDQLNIQTGKKYTCTVTQYSKTGFTWQRDQGTVSEVDSLRECAAEAVLEMSSVSMPLIDDEGLLMSMKFEYVLSRSGEKSPVGSGVLTLQ